MTAEARIGCRTINSGQRTYGRDPETFAEEGLDPFDRVARHYSFAETTRPRRRRYSRSTVLDFRRFGRERRNPRRVRTRVRLETGDAGKKITIDERRSIPTGPGTRNSIAQTNRRRKPVESCRGLRRFRRTDRLCIPIDLFRSARNGFGCRTRFSSLYDFIS